MSLAVVLQLAAEAAAEWTQPAVHQPAVVLLVKQPAVLQLVVVLLAKQPAVLQLVVDLLAKQLAVLQLVVVLLVKQLAVLQLVVEAAAEWMHLAVHHLLAVVTQSVAMAVEAAVAKVADLAARSADSSCLSFVCLSSSCLSFVFVSAVALAVAVAAA